MKNLQLTIIFTALSICVYAQQPDVDAMRKQMEKLMIMEGTWEGSGWSQQGQIERNTFNQTEVVTSYLDGLALVVNGIGNDPETGEKVFEALGVFSAKSDSIYSFKTYTMEGQSTDAKAKFDNDMLIWWFEISQGQKTATIQYEIQLTESTWIEDGYYMPSPDAKYHFFHMELEKQE